MIAIRRLYERGKPRRRAELQIGLPTRIRDGRRWLWTCPFQLRGIGNDRVQRVFGYDSLQALELVFLALRSALDATGRRFSLGPEEMPDDPGVMIARHVPYALGGAFEQHLHRIIDREIEAHVAKLHRRALPTRSAVVVDGAVSTRARARTK